MTIPRDTLAELYQRLAQAIGAVERGNLRAAGNKRLDACVRAIWEAGVPGEGC